MGYNQALIKEPALSVDPNRTQRRKLILCRRLDTTEVQ